MRRFTVWKDDGAGGTIPVVIEKDLPDLVPKVGIFFYVDDVTIMDAVPVEKGERCEDAIQYDGESYGDAIQYGGHYEFWEALVPKTLAERKLKAGAYDVYPRGRVVFLPGKKEYIVYGDQCFTTDELGVIACDQFELDEIFDNGLELGVERDPHYKCAQCNPHFID